MGTRPRCLPLVAAAVGIALLGCKADPPGKLETKIVTAAKHHVFIRGKSQKNPLPVSAATITDGKEAFSHYCAACHGLAIVKENLPCRKQAPSRSLDSHSSVRRE